MTPLDIYWQHCEGPIVYGINDCCMTVADVVVAAGGTDLMQDYRGRYKTRIGFQRLLRKARIGDLSNAVAAALRRYGYDVETAQDFDVALVSYVDASGLVTAPAFFHSGLWFSRTDSGSIAIKHEAFDVKLNIYRVP